MSDTKHGWVTPRADGARARCGGPAICSTCQTEQMHETMLNGVFGKAAAEPKSDSKGASQGWRDIESAPKDGTPVLLFARHIDTKASTRVVGSFNAHYGWIAQSYRGQSIARLIPSLWAELMPFPGSPASTVATEGEQRDAVMDAIAAALGDAYDCTRVWSAWGVGTMSQDDFCLVTDDAGRLGELADAAIAAMTPAPAAGDALDAARYRWLCDKFGITKLPCAIERIIEGTYVADGKSGIDAAIDAAIAQQSQRKEA